MNYDLIVIGGGPAGMTSALYGARAGLKTLVVEKMFAGGQAATTYHIDNYPGFAEGVDGPTLMNDFKKQAERFGAEFLNATVDELDLQGKKLRIKQTVYQAKAIIIATGARYRLLGVEKEDLLKGSGVSYCATCDGNFFKGRTVAVVGGGDTALEDALFLSNICQKVYLIHRRDQFRGTKVLQESVNKSPVIEILYDSVVTKLMDENMALSKIEVKNVKTDQKTELKMDGLFVAVGMIPESELFRDKVDMDQNGYIIVNQGMETSLPGIFAAGDVTNTVLRQIITSAADGAKAAVSAERYIATLED